MGNPKAIGKEQGTFITLSQEINQRREFPSL